MKFNHLLYKQKDLFKIFIIYNKIFNILLKNMDKLNDNSFIKLIERIDYLTKYNLKYTCKKIKNRIEKLHLDEILDLRNTKYENNNNIIYKILLKHKNILTKVILEFQDINNSHINKFTDKLTYINLNYCQKIDNDALIHIANTCHNLIHLELYIIPNISDQGLKQIIMKCPKLIYLNLSGCSHFGEESLLLLPKYLPNIEFLDLTRNYDLTDKCLEEIVKGCKNLKHLNLYALPKLEMNFLKNMNCINLEFLDLCGNQNITDEHFKKVAEKINNIKSLNLSWCTGLTDKTVEYMFSEDKNQNLELISLHGILGITDKSVEILKNNKGIVKSLNTIDLVACSNVKNRDNKYIKNIFKNVECFQVFF